MRSLEVMGVPAEAKLGSWTAIKSGEEQCHQSSYTGDFGAQLQTQFIHLTI